MLRIGVCRVIGKRANSSSSFRKWSNLSTYERQRFVTQFVNNYKEQYPGSKTNVSLKGLALDMEKFDDAPSVFGIFYNDIWELFHLRRNAIYSEKSTDKKESQKKYGRFGHSSFLDLLVE